MSAIHLGTGEVNPLSAGRKKGHLSPTPTPATATTTTAAAAAASGQALLPFPLALQCRRCALFAMLRNFCFFYLIVVHIALTSLDSAEAGSHVVSLNPFHCTSKTYEPLGYPGQRD